MTKELIAMMLEEARIGVDELAGNCAVDRAWVVEYVQAGVLLEGVEPDPARWSFTSRATSRVSSTPTRSSRGWSWISSRSSTACASG
jgi:hypothetical protein